MVSPRPADDGPAWPASRSTAKCSGGAAAPRHQLTRREVQALVEAGGARLVEALGPMYYADAHLPGAVNIPPDLVRELAPVLLPGKDDPVVTYCSDATCNNSAVVARRLRELGYTDVATYPAGKQDWIVAGLPVERGELDGPW